MTECLEVIRAHVGFEILGEVNTQSNSLCCHSCHTFAACKWILFVKPDSTALFISSLSSEREFFDRLSRLWRRRRRWKQHSSSVKSNDLLVIWLLASWALTWFKNTAGRRCHCWSQIRSTAKHLGKVADVGTVWKQLRQHLTEVVSTAILLLNAMCATNNKYYYLLCKQHSIFNQNYAIAFVILIIRIAISYFSYW